MIIGTAPTLTLKLRDGADVDFNEAENIYFTIRQGSISLTKSTSDIIIDDENTIKVSLTQEETLQFKYNLQAEIKLNWTYADGTRSPTKVKKFVLFKNLLREVIE